MFLLYIEAASVVNNKKSSAVGGNNSVGVEFNVKDYYAIQVETIPFTSVFHCKFIVFYSLSYLMTTSTANTW